MPTTQHIQELIESLLPKMFARLTVFRWPLIRASSPPSILFPPSFMTSGLKRCSPPSSAPAPPPPPPPPPPHSLFCMILIDSFIDCKEIGCSYNTAGLVGVMKKGIWLQARSIDAERGGAAFQPHGWQRFIPCFLTESFGKLRQNKKKTARKLTDPESVGRVCL